MDRFVLNVHSVVLFGVELLKIMPPQVFISLASESSVCSSPCTLAQAGCCSTSLFFGAGLISHKQCLTFF